MTDCQRSDEPAAVRLARAMLADRPGLTGDRLREIYPGVAVMAAVAEAVDALRDK